MKKSGKFWYVTQEYAFRGGAISDGISYYYNSLQEAFDHYLECIRTLDDAQNCAFSLYEVETDADGEPVDGTCIACKSTPTFDAEIEKFEIH